MSKALHPLVVWHEAEHSSIVFVPASFGNPLDCQPYPRQRPVPIFENPLPDEE